MASSADRHPSTDHMLRQLRPNENLPAEQLTIAEMFWGVGVAMVGRLGDSPELTAGLRKLLEAKDCFVRASLDLDPVDYRDR